MNIGIGIVSFDRPDYLKQLIRSLEANDLSDTEFHLFQDGYICKFTGEECTHPRNISLNVEIFRKSNLPKKICHLRDSNVSVAINQFEAMQTLRQNYRYFIFLEDDIIVSPHFILIMKKLLGQYENDQMIACISPSFRIIPQRNLKSFDVRSYLDKVAFLEGHFWAEACWSTKWSRVEKAYLPYYNIVKEQPYKDRDHREEEILTLLEKEMLSLYKRKKHPFPTSQDVGKDWAIRVAGMRRLRLVVNRATGIGDYGFHSGNPEAIIIKDKHNKIYAFEEELKIKEFKVIEWFEENEN